MIAFESDRAKKQPDSFTSTPTGHIWVQEVISLPWDVFTGPAACQSLYVKSLFGLMCYLFHASLWVWLYSMNNQLDHCKSELLNDCLMSDLKRKPPQSFYPYSGMMTGHWLPFISENWNNHQHLLPLLLFPFFIKNLKPSSNMKHSILSDTYVQLHVSTSLVISDPVILIAHKHKEGKIG